MGGSGPAEGAAAGPVPRDWRPAAVLFDLFHTLIDVNWAPGPASSEILGIDPATWNARLMYEARHHALGEVADPYESLRRVAHAIDPTIPEERIREAVAVRPLRFRHALLEVPAETLAGLARLQALGLPLALVSNAGLDEVEAWPDSPLAPYFGAALFSCHEKVMKPDPAIYLRAAQRLRVDPARCLFVGDGGSGEHDGARAAGMRTVLLLGLLTKSLPGTAASRPRNTDWVLETMDELATLVESLVKAEGGSTR
jgi:putative hydrolase of the HAD superfamily